MLIIGGLGRGFDPQRYFNVDTHRVLYCPVTFAQTTNTVAQSVERTTLNARSVSLFFCLAFVYPHILHAGKFWDSLDKVGSRT